MWSVVWSAKPFEAYREGSRGRTPKKSAVQLELKPGTLATLAVSVHLCVLVSTVTHRCCVQKYNLCMTNIILAHVAGMAPLASPHPTPTIGALEDMTARQFMKELLRERDVRIAHHNKVFREEVNECGNESKATPPYHVDFDEDLVFLKDCAPYTLVASLVLLGCTIPYACGVVFDENGFEGKGELVKKVKGRILTLDNMSAIGLNSENKPSRWIRNVHMTLTYKAHVNTARDAILRGCMGTQRHRDVTDSMYALAKKVSEDPCGTRKVKEMSTNDPEVLPHMAFIVCDNVNMGHRGSFGATNDDYLLWVRRILQNIPTETIEQLPTDSSVVDEIRQLPPFEAKQKYQDFHGMMYANSIEGTLDDVFTFERKYHIRLNPRDVEHQLRQPVDDRRRFISENWTEEIHKTVHSSFVAPGDEEMSQSVGSFLDFRMLAVDYCRTQSTFDLHGSFLHDGVREMYAFGMGAQVNHTKLQFFRSTCTKSSNYEEVVSDMDQFMKGIPSGTLVLSVNDMVSRCFLFTTFRTQPSIWAANSRDLGQGKRWFA